MADRKTIECCHVRRKYCGYASRDKDAYSVVLRSGRGFDTLMTDERRGL
ncbi:MAG: hypothetical protein K2O03_16050 [Lachnospiraceae bacterium]|nr:hypothetical protein [Lachnospiraceae bacterium]